MPGPLIPMANRFQPPALETGDPVQREAAQRRSLFAPSPFRFEPPPATSLFKPNLGNALIAGAQGFFNAQQGAEQTAYERERIARAESRDERTFKEQQRLADVAIRKQVLEGSEAISKAMPPGLPMRDRLISSYTKSLYQYYRGEGDIEDLAGALGGALSLANIPGLEGGGMNLFASNLSALSTEHQKEFKRPPTDAETRVLVGRAYSKTHAELADDYRSGALLKSVQVRVAEKQIDALQSEIDERTARIAEMGTLTDDDENFIATIPAHMTALLRETVSYLTDAARIGGRNSPLLQSIAEKFAAGDPSGRIDLAGITDAAPGVKTNLKFVQRILKQYDKLSERYEELLALGGPQGEEGEIPTPETPRPGGLEEAFTEEPPSPPPTGIRLVPRRKPELPETPITGISRAAGAQLERGLAGIPGAPAIAFVKRGVAWLRGSTPEQKIGFAKTVVPKAMADEDYLAALVDRTPGLKGIPVSRDAEGKTITLGDLPDDRRLEVLRRVRGQAGTEEFRNFLAYVLLGEELFDKWESSAGVR